MQAGSSQGESGEVASLVMLRMTIPAMCVYRLCLLMIIPNADALDHMYAGRNKGKVVVSLSADAREVGSATNTPRL